jgi:hypothetical protein
MFPDWQTRLDTVNRRTVRVRAETTMGPNQTVFFKAFDPDDPSDNFAPVDPNGNAGNDNRGTPNVGTLSAAQATTDSNGVATVVLTTTMHPGDNFMVAASKDQTYLNSISAVGTTLKDSSGNTLPTVKAKATPMLTMWRKLHIEVDSMGQVSQNRVNGTITTIVPSAGSNGTRHEVVVASPTLEPCCRYYEGEASVTIGGVVYGVTGVFNNVISISTPNGITPTGSSFSLDDDDDYNENSSSFNSDEGEDVDQQLATFSIMQHSDNHLLNVFAPAYIKPFFDGGGRPENNETNIAFDVNSSTEEQDIADKIALGEDSQADESDAFWVVYVLLAYQPETHWDGDWNFEDSIGGTTWARTTDDVTSAADVPDGSRGSLVFLETISDADGWQPYDFKIRTAPHEIGHQMGIDGDNGGHPEFGLMNSDPFGGITFCPAHLNLLRWRVHSPGTL